MMGSGIPTAYLFYNILFMVSLMWAIHCRESIDAIHTVSWCSFGVSFWILNDFSFLNTFFRRPRSISLQSSSTSLSSSRSLDHIPMSGRLYLPSLILLLVHSLFYCFTKKLLTEEVTLSSSHHLQQCPTIQMQELHEAIKTSIHHVKTSHQDNQETTCFNFKYLIEYLIAE